MSWGASSRMPSKAILVDLFLGSLSSSWGTCFPFPQFFRHSDCYSLLGAEARVLNRFGCCCLGLLLEKLFCVVDLSRFIVDFMGYVILFSAILPPFRSLFFVRSICPCAESLWVLLSWAAFVEALRFNFVLSQRYLSLFMFFFFLVQSEV